jgi:hypothetical protein
MVFNNFNHNQKNSADTMTQANICGDFLSNSCGRFETSYYRINISVMSKQGERIKPISAASRTDPVHHSTLKS